jgi:hypothetical protein
VSLPAVPIDDYRSPAVVPESGWPSIATRHTACNVINRHFSAEGGSFAAVSTGIISPQASKELSVVSRECMRV